jgi:hypothetical protein
MASKRPERRALCLACGVIVAVSLSPANASALTFDFDAAYNAAASASAGNLGNLTDFSVGLVNGQIIHGSFSYDPASAPTVTIPASESANYTATFSFTIPSLTISAPAANASVINFFNPLADDVFGVGSSLALPSSPGHTIGLAFNIILAGPGALASTTPAALDLADFSTQSQFFLVQSDFASGQFVGQSQLLFDLTSVTAETPLPAALPMFLGGAGLLGLLARRRKQRRVATAY